MATLNEQPVVEPTTADFPVALAQEPLWHYQQLNPSSPSFNLHLWRRLYGPLDVTALRRAVRQLVARHEPLRTTFPAVGGVPVQRIDTATRTELKLVDLSALPAAQAEALARQRAAEESCRAFGLTRDPPIRAQLVRLAADDHILLISVHHIVADDLSMGIVRRELSALYNGTAVEPAEPSLQYVDFAVWQQESLDEAARSAEIEFWRSTLDGVPRTLELPGLTVGETGAPAGAEHRIRLPGWLTTDLKDLARSEGVSLFMVLLAAFARALGQLTGRTDIPVATVVSSRDRDEVQDVLGLFVNALPVRINFDDDPAFPVLLHRVRRAVLAVLAHKNLPYPINDIARAGLQLIQAPPATAADLSLRDIRVVPFPGPAQHAKFDIFVDVLVDGDELDCRFVYDPRRYPLTTMEMLARQFRSLASGQVAGGDVSIGVGEVVSFPGGLVLGGGAGDVAVVDDEVSVSYEVFDEWVGRFAQRLRALGVGRGVRVGVCLPRSVELLVAVWAVARAGGVLVPLDTSSPDVRLRGMVGDAGVALVVDAGSGNWGVPWVGVPAMGSGGAALRAGVVEVADDDPAYVLFTSGSTGRPKGVVVSRGALTNRLSWMVRDQGLCSADRVLCKTAIGFDVSLWELFGVLRVGGQVVVARDGGHRDPSYLVDVMRRCRITVVHFVPSMLPVFLDALCADGAGLPDLRLVVCSGEVLPPDLAQRCLKMLPEARLENLYGPTEAGIDVSRWRCVPGWSGVRVPIGSAVPNTQLYVLDGAGDPAAVGVVGELFIGGVQVAEGYAGAPGLTAHRFVPDPFTPGGGRLYRTGDRGRWLDGGALEFLGRMDEQVKIRGQRVEPGEIEGVLAKFSGVRAAVVMVRDRQAGEPVLTAWVHAPGPAVQVSALRDYLVRRLPAHMVPAEFVVVADWPLNASGKTDRLALLQMPAVTGSASGGPVAGSGGGATATERELLHMWEQLLGVPRMGIGDDFFDLGGHSLLAARLVNRIRDAFGIALPLGAIFEHSTITALATLIDTWHAPTDRRYSQAQARADAALDLPIPTDPPPSVSAGPLADVLVTGANGLVGAFLVHALLKDTDARIWCLVRGADDAAALDRLATAGAALGLSPLPADRIDVVAGDVAQPSLGLSEARYRALADTVDTVFHNAATVSLLRAYPSLRQVNVLGTREVLRFAVEGRRKHLHHTSTLSVIPWLALDKPHWPCEEDVPNVDFLTNGYAQTKWVAEQLVRRAGRAGVPVTVHRLARITGDSHTGAWSANDFLARMLITAARTGTLPRREMGELWTPVDQVTADLVHIARRGEADGLIIHHADTRPVDALTLREWFDDAGFPVTLLDWPEWLDAIEQDTDGPLQLFLTTLRSMPPREPSGRRPDPPFAVTNLHNGLAGQARSSRLEPGPELLGRYLHRFAAEGRLSDPTSW